MLDHIRSVCGRVEGLRADSADEPWRADVPAEILTTERDKVDDGDSVVDVGEPIDARESRLTASQQRFEAVASALGLGTE
jgi:hypothetical protein